jgi:hypothetical protein
LLFGAGVYLLQRELNSEDGRFFRKSKGVETPISQANTGIYQMQKKERLLTAPYQEKISHHFTGRLTSG